MLCFRGMSFLPVGVGVVMASALVTTYVVSVYSGHVEALFPYISDTGVEIPERCIFSQFFNMAAFIALSAFYLRYKLIREITQDFDTRVARLAKVNLGVACLSCLGLSIVANFQETQIESMHLTGAAMVFGLGVVYMGLDTNVSYKMCPAYNGRYVCRCRLVLTIAGLISLVTTIIFGVIARMQWEAHVRPGESRLHWTKDDPGYWEHLVSTFGEWSMAGCFMFYFFTYIRDFQKFHLEVKTHLQVSHLDEEPEMVPGETTRLLT